MGQEVDSMRQCSKGLCRGLVHLGCRGGLCYIGAVALGAIFDEKPKRRGHE